MPGGNSGVIRDCFRLFAIAAVYDISARVSHSWFAEGPSQTNDKGSTGNEIPWEGILLC